MDKFDINREPPPPSPATDNSDMELFHSYGFISSSRKVKSGSTVHFYANFGPEARGNPIMVLLHGYPQTSFMWRYVAQRGEFLADEEEEEHARYFIPDLPGYGRSTPANKHDKRSVGVSVLEALKSYLAGSALYDSIDGGPVCRDDRNLRIVLVGHDRGARVAHRLAVDITNEEAWKSEDDPSFAILRKFTLDGLVIMDTLPTAAQWEIFGSSSKNAARSFHWPLLANVDLATDMIKAYGGGKWCKEMIKRWSGPPPMGQDSLRSYGDAEFGPGPHRSALDVYARYFDQESVIRATCEDYRAGAEEDVTAQEADQAAQRLVKAPTFVLYSSDYSGKRYGAKMKEIWAPWVFGGEKGVSVREVEDCGHFLAEERPVDTRMALRDFWDRFMRMALKRDDPDRYEEVVKAEDEEWRRYLDQETAQDFDREDGYVS